ncbi:Solute carrier organic anion transporter family member 5A1 [Taenia crassiceps]|uniref:Solute carrier organic anion transporter family member 5A1 n=1 Tax=Taenia crassiceps TaxID=6207 RepID=A0ABR4QKJ9_9CEST
MSCGAFLFSTPQFLFPYDSSFSSGNNEHLCSLDLPLNRTFSKKSSCNTKVDGSYHFLPILLLAQFLIGAGSSPILTLAPPFVDDHVSPSKAPAMIASLYAAAALGPVFGYALGALMLQHPMDKWSRTKIIGSTLTPVSDDWIGLWWAGYIILGLGVFIGASILIMFPRTLRSSFTPHKRSLESDMIAGSSNSGGTVDGMLNDPKPNSPTESSQPFSFPVFQTQPNSHQSYQQRAVYQHHHRSFSGNVPVTSAPPLSVGGTTQGASFFPPRHHQRSASVSSILLHAAIIAATASHAAEEEDEAPPSTETDSDSSSGDTTPSPDERERLDKRQSRIDQSINEMRRGSRLFRSPVYRSKSLSAQQQQQQQYSRRWTSAFWSSRSPSRGVLLQSCGRPLRWSQKGTPPGVPPPILDVMMEDSNSELPTTSVIKNNAKADDGSDLAGNDASASSVGARRLHPPILEGDSGAPPHSSSNANSPSPPFTPTASASKPSIFVHLHKHRKRRPRKIIRGRIFGFLADWSKDIPKSIFSLLKNKIYVVTCLCICCEMFIVIGFAGFLPKYMEIEYQISKATASMIAGGLIVPSGALGILAGGLILNKARLSQKGAVLFVFGVNFFIVGCMSSFFFLGCENPKIAGFTVPYPSGSSTAVNTSASRTAKPWEVECCRSCGCNPNVWKPVCHAKTSTIFFSPCYAGCAKGPTFLPASNQYIYYHCHCLRSFADTLNNHSVSLRDSSMALVREAGGVDGVLSQIFDDEVFAGVCAPGCKMLMPFVCFLTVLLFLTGVIQNPLLMVTMRSVRHSQRSLALGLQFVIIRLLANLPSPIAFGRAIDGACLLWKDECGRRGDCAFMDLKQLTQYITGLGVTVKGSSLLIYIVLIYLLARRRPNADEEMATTKLRGDDAFKQRSVLDSHQAVTEAVKT